MQGLDFKNTIERNRLLQTYAAVYQKQEKTVARSELLADIRVGDSPGDIKKKREGKRKIAGRKRPSRNKVDNERRKTEVGQGYPGAKDVSDAAHIAAVGATSFPKAGLFAIAALRRELAAADVVTLQKPHQPISSFALDTAARAIMSSIVPMPTEKGLLFAVLRPHSVQKLARVGLSVQDMGQLGVWVVTRAVSSFTSSSSSHSLTHEYVWSLSTLASTVTSFDVLDKLIILFLMNVNNDSHWLLGCLKERILHIFDSFPALTESKYKVPYPVKNVMKNFFVATGLALSTTFVPYETILVTSPHQATTAECEGDTETCGMFMISNFLYVLKLKNSSLIGDPINMSDWSYVPRNWLLEKLNIQDDFAGSTAAFAAFERDIDFEFNNGAISAHEYLQVCKVLAQSKPDSITFSEETKESSLRQLLSYKAVLENEAASVETKHQISRAALGPANFQYEVVISDSVKLSHDDMNDLRARTRKMFSDQHIQAIIAIANNAPVTPVGGCQSLLFAHEPNPFLQYLLCETAAGGLHRCRCRNSI